MSYRSASYDQAAVLPDGRPVTLLWGLTLERGEPSQGGGWGIADASLDGFVVVSGTSFRLGDQATREMLEDFAGAGWLAERENELQELDGDDLQKLLGRP